MQNELLIEMNEQNIPVLKHKRIQDPPPAWSGPIHTILSVEAKRQCKIFERLRFANVSDRAQMDRNRTNFFESELLVITPSNRKKISAGEPEDETKKDKCLARETNSDKNQSARGGLVKIVLWRKNKEKNRKEIFGQPQCCSIH